VWARNGGARETPATAVGGRGQLARSRETRASSSLGCIVALDRAPIVVRTALWSRSAREILLSSPCHGAGPYTYAAITIAETGNGCEHSNSEPHSYAVISTVRF
jgi:hypothetical protein